MEITNVPTFWRSTSKGSFSTDMNGYAFHSLSVSHNLWNYVSSKTACGPSRTTWWTTADHLLNRRGPPAESPRTTWWTTADHLVNHRRPHGKLPRTTWWTTVDHLVNRRGRPGEPRAPPGKSPRTTWWITADHLLNRRGPAGEPPRTTW
jgi:hypothetical protein